MWPLRTCLGKGFRNFAFWNRCVLSAVHKNNGRDLFHFDENYNILTLRDRSTLPLFPRRMLLGFGHMHGNDMGTIQKLGMLCCLINITGAQLTFHLVEPLTRATYT